MLLYLAMRWRDLADDDEIRGRRDTQIAGLAFAEDSHRTPQRGSADTRIRSDSD